jgi:hypothetical protein
MAYSQHNCLASHSRIACRRSALLSAEVKATLPDRIVDENRPLMKPLSLLPFSKRVFFILHDD